MWDLIVSVPDHCLSFYFGLSMTDSVTSAVLREVEIVETPGGCSDFGCTGFGCSGSGNVEGTLGVSIFGWSVFGNAEGTRGSSIFG